MLTVLSITSRKILLATALWVCLFTGVALSQTHAAETDSNFTDWVIERLEKTIDPDAITHLSVENQFGDVRVRTSKSGNIELIAVYQHHKSVTDIPALATSTADSGLSITVEYPERLNTEEQLPVLQQKRRIDVALLAPREVQLTLKTRHGRAETKGHRGDVSIETDTGSIIAAGFGAVQATTVSGNIAATFRNREWLAPSSLVSQSSNIDVLLIEHPDVTADIATAGDIITDYSIDIVAQPGSNQKKGKSQIGEGTQTLTIRSATGNIAVRRIFDMLGSTTTQ